MTRITLFLRAARFSVAAIAVLALAGFGGGSLSAAADTPATGSISGVVTDSVTHQPLAGMSVSLIEFSGTQVFIGPQTTDADGHFSFTSLPPGDYSLEVSDNTSGYQGNGVSGISLTVSAPTVTEDIALTKFPTGTGIISGTVVDAAGHPLSGADISLHGGVTNTRNTRSDSTGHFEFAGLATDIDNVWVQALGYVGQTRDIDTNNDAVVLDPFVLIPADVTITGLITDEAGDPVSGIFVTFTSAGGSGLGHTRGDGSYTASYLGAGDYTMTVGGSGTPWQAQSVPLAVHSGSNSLDIHLVHRITGTISGRIVDAAGDGVSGECLMVSDTVTGVPTSVILSDENGQYTVSDLDAGDYLVRVRSCDSNINYGTTYLGGNSPTEATIVTVAAGDDVNVDDITLAPAASISGHIDVVTPTGLAPLPVNHGFVVNLYQRSGNQWLDYKPDDLIAVTGTGPDGNGDYTVGGLPAGDYRVAFIDPLPGKRAYTGQFWSVTTPAGVASLDNATTVTVVAGENLTGKNADLTITRPSSAPDPATTAALTSGEQGQITAAGTVTSGDPITVTIGPDHVGEWVSVWGHSTPVLMGNWAQVAKDGTVTVTVPTSLEAGSHRLVAQSADNQVIGWEPLEVTPAAVVPPLAVVTPQAAVVTPPVKPAITVASPTVPTVDQASPSPSGSIASSPTPDATAAPLADAGVKAVSGQPSQNSQPWLLIVLASLGAMLIAGLIIVMARRARAS